MTDIVESGKLGDFKPDPRNVRAHDPRNVGMIVDSIQRDGFGRSMLAVKDGTIIAGNATSDASGEAGMEDVIVVHSDGTRPIIVVRDDLTSDSPEATRLAIADNRATDLSRFDASKVVTIAASMDVTSFWNPDEMKAIMAEAAGAMPDAPAKKPGTDPLPEMWGIVVELESEAQQIEMLTDLSRRGYVCRALL